MPWLFVAEKDYPGSYSAFWLLVDTFAAGLVAFILGMQWRWYINIRRDVKLVKRSLLTGIIDRAHLDEVDIGDFNTLGAKKKPEAPKLLGPARKPMFEKPVLDDAKRRMIVQLRWLAMQANKRRNDRLRRPKAEVDAETRGIKMYVDKYIARRRAVNLIHVLAADKYKGGSLELSVRSLDAMRRLSQYGGFSGSTYMIVEHGGLSAALEAMEHFPQSADVQWHACTLFGNIGLSLVLLVRLHLHPEIKHGRTALLIIRAIAEFPQDVRVQGAACGALWTLVMATGKPGQEMAIRGGAVPLLVSAVKRHPQSGVVVYNACGAVLSIAQGFPDVQTILQGDGSTRILRDAMEKHGGIEEMYGTEVARLADWVAVNAKPKRDKANLPGKTEYVTEKLYHEEYGLVPITPANRLQLRGGPRMMSPGGTERGRAGPLKPGQATSQGYY